MPPRLLSYTLFLSFCILSTSCTQKIYLQDASPENDTEYIETNDVSVATRYSGDAFDYIIFEIDIDNLSDETIELSSRDVKLMISDNEGLRDRKLRAIDKDYLIDMLYNEQELVKRERTARNVGGIVNLGLTLLGGVAGNNTLNTAIYATDSAAAIIDNNRAYKLISGSIEDQIIYLEDWVLKKDTIGPGESGSWDILFDRYLIEGNATLEISNGQLDHAFPYQLYIREEKIRR